MLIHLRVSGARVGACDFADFRPFRGRNPRPLVHGGNARGGALHSFLRFPVVLFYFIVSLDNPLGYAGQRSGQIR